MKCVCVALQQSSPWCPLWRWMCPLCVCAAGGGCCGFVFIRSMCRVKPGTIRTALVCIFFFFSSPKYFWISELWKDQKWWPLRGGFIPTRSQTHHGSASPLIYSIWTELPNIYPSLFFPVYSNQSVLHFHSLQFCMWIRFLFVAVQLVVLDTSVSTDQGLSCEVNVLLHPPGLTFLQGLWEKKKKAT